MDLNGTETAEYPNGYENVTAFDYVLFENGTAIARVPGRMKINDYMIVGAFLVGIIGNILALAILFSSSRPKNSKHVLMLRSLAINDLVAQLGMLSMKVFRLQMPEFSRCVLIVLLRAIGLGSGCVAFVMALERWLALTRPFLYQQIVTYQFLMKTIIILWSTGALVTYLPFFNVGVFYKVADGEVQCVRYRDADEVKDVIYAWAFFTFGTGLCVCIVVYNTSVFLVLARLGNSKTSKLVRRVSRTMMKCVKPQYSTNEELAFARLMAFLCVTFVVCWMPDMICVVWAQIERSSHAYVAFSIIANVFKSIYFTVDPYVYVIYQYVTKRKRKVSNRRSFPMLKKGNALPSSTDATTPTSILLHQKSFTTTTTVQVCM